MTYRYRPLTPDGRMVFRSVEDDAYELRFASEEDGEPLVVLLLTTEQAKQIRADLDRLLK